jgi:hypothetical protein
MFVELAIREPHVSRDNCDAVGHGVDDTLEQVSDVELQRMSSRIRSYSPILT